MYVPIELTYVTTDESAGRHDGCTVARRNEWTYI